jgi:glycosyltransferase involved in cell wall biosynthesis
LQCEANGAGLVVKVFKHDLVAEKGQSLDAQQLVSCLTVTRNRLALVKRAVRCFQAQSYSQRELLVLDDGEDETGPFIASLGEPLIRHVRPERVGMKLGELRNLAIRLAGGKYVMQWDDDDWYHPNRIKVQLAALEYTNSQFCLLSRWTLAWPAKGLFCHSKELCWEGSLLGLKEAMPQYPDLVRGEDSVLVGALLHGTARMCFVDNPELYIYTVHGSNTYPTEHFEKSIFDRHTGALSEAEVRRVLEKLAF